MSLSSSRLLLLLRSASSSFLSLLWIVLVLLLVGTTVNASNSNDQNSSSRSSSRSSSPTATPSTITINKYIPTVDESSQLLSTSCASSSSSSFSSIGDSSTISSSSSAAAWGNILPPSHESTPYKEDPTNKSLKMKIFDDSKNNDFKKLMKRRRKFNNLWIDNDDDDDYAYADDPNTADIDGIRKWLKCNKNKSNDNSSNNNNNNILPTKEDYEILLRAYRYAMIQNGYNTHDSNHVGIGNEESSSLSVSAWFKVPVEINTKINNGGGVYAKEDIKRGTLIYGTPTKNQNDNHDSNRIVSIAEFPTRDTYREFFGFLTRGLEWDATANLACDAFLWSYPILQKQKKVSSSSLSSSYSICLPIGSDRVYLNHASTEEEGENIFQYIPEDDEDNEDNDEDIDIDGDSGGCPNNDELPVYALRDIKAGEGGCTNVFVVLVCVLSCFCCQLSLPLSFVIINHHLPESVSFSNFFFFLFLLSFLHYCCYILYAIYYILLLYYCFRITY